MKDTNKGNGDGTPADQVELTPLEVLFVSVAPLVKLAALVIEAAQDSPPAMIQNVGIYARKKADVITLDGSNDRVVLVGMQIPISAADGIRRAFAAAGETPFAANLRRKIGDDYGVHAELVLPGRGEGQKVEN